MMRGGWLLSIYRENFVDNIRRSLKERGKKKKNRERNKKVGVGIKSTSNGGKHPPIAILPFSQYATLRLYICSLTVHRLY